MTRPARRPRSCHLWDGPHERDGRTRARRCKPAATPDLAEPAVRPRRADLTLLATLQRVVADGERLTRAAMATRLGISREAVRQRLANPGRPAWLNAQLEAGARECGPPAGAPRAVAAARA
jgi:hypothetical protein